MVSDKNINSTTVGGGAAERTVLFVLSHEYSIRNEELDWIDLGRIVGVFASYEDASSALEEARKLPGFRDLGEESGAEFVIDEYELDEMTWTTGFETVHEGSS